MEISIYREIIEYLRKIIKDTEWEDKVFSVGGCVRDLLLKKEIKDIDLVVEVPEGGLKFTEWLKKNSFLKGDPVLYPNYGTSMFRLNDYPEYPIEAVCTRKERYPDPKTRNPETAFGTLRDDCFRRDLTINALYHNISTDKIIDLAHGISDMKNKILRTTDEPEIIFEDDPLRILRIIRFWGKLGTDWRMTGEIIEGMRKLRKRLTILSKERVCSELLQILCTDEASRCLSYMANIEILSVILPQIDLLRGCKQGPQHFGDVFMLIDTRKEYELALPILIGKSINSSLIEKGGIEKFQKVLLSRYCLSYNKKDLQLIKPSGNKNMNIPLHILTKFLVKFYTAESYDDNNFYRQLNLDLTNDKFDEYHPFIFLIYDSLNKGYLKSYNGTLYRGGKLNKSEFRKIISEKKM